MEIILIIGLPGSGKTHFAKSMLLPGDFFIDDVMRNKEIITGLDVSQYSRVIMTDPACLVSRSDIENKLISWFGTDHDYQIIAFDNDPEIAWTNLRARGDGRQISKPFFDMLAKVYRPQQYDRVIPVYRNPITVH